MIVLHDAQGFFDIQRRCSLSVVGGNGDISFSPVLWQCFMRVLKPGGYAAFFTAPRLLSSCCASSRERGFHYNAASGVAVP